MRFIEGHVMFQIRGQNEPTHELPFATAKAHMCAHVMGNIGKQGCPLSGDGGRGCMQGCAQPLINIGVRCLSWQNSALTPKFDIFLIIITACVKDSIQTWEYLKL